MKFEKTAIGMTDSAMTANASDIATVAEISVKQADRAEADD